MNKNILNGIIETIKKIEYYNDDSIKLSMYNLISTYNLSSNYENIGTLKLNNFILFIWFDKKEKIIKVGELNEKCEHFYKIKTRKDITNLVSLYSVTKPKVIYMYSKKLYLKSQKKVNIDILLETFIKKKIKIFNERDEIYSLSKINSINSIKNIINKEIIDKNISYFYILSPISKSIIKLSYYPDKIIIDIEYDKIELQNPYEIFDNFLPKDINILFENFEIMPFEIVITNMKKKIRTDYDDHTFNLILEMCTNKSEVIDLNKLNLSQNQKKKIVEKITEIELNNLWKNVETNSIFKSYEYGLENFIKSIYEEFSVLEFSEQKNSYLKDKIYTKLYYYIKNNLI